jgi:hypothetical protein
VNSTGDIHSIVREDPKDWPSAGPVGHRFCLSRRSDLAPSESEKSEPEFMSECETAEMPMKLENVSDSKCFVASKIDLKNRFFNSSGAKKTNGKTKLNRESQKGVKFSAAL